jgi:hypothetical protein
MRKISCFIITLMSLSCGSVKVKEASKNLYEVLTVQEDGGGNIHFFEIISETKEFPMILGDENLKEKLKPNDINTANFIILNLGAQTQKGATIEVASMDETATQIIVSLKESTPPTTAITEVDPVYPYTILKINSKKEIVIKE